MRCRSIQRFCGAHPTHQALAPSSPMSFHDKSMFVTDAFVFSASAKAWKQSQIKAGVFIQALRLKTWSLKSGEHMTLHLFEVFSLIQNPPTPATCRGSAPEEKWR